VAIAQEIGQRADIDHQHGGITVFRGSGLMDVTALLAAFTRYLG
jgi:hypothetical protein